MIEDLSVFFQDFAIPAAVEQSPGVTVEIKVIFDASDSLQTVFDTGIEAATPSILVKTVDAESLSANKRLNLKGKFYRVARSEAQHDGDLTRIWLK